MTWQDHALCREIDAELFYPPDSDPGVLAKRICAGCDVRSECLAAALAYEGRSSRVYRHGVWGGLSPGQRAQLARRAS